MISLGELRGFRGSSSRVWLGAGTRPGLAVAWLSRSPCSCPAPRGSSSSPGEKGRLGSREPRAPLGSRIPGLQGLSCCFFPVLEALWGENFGRWTCGAEAVQRGQPRRGGGRTGTVAVPGPSGAGTGGTCAGFPQPTEGLESLAPSASEKAPFISLLMKSASPKGCKTKQRN